MIRNVVVLNKLIIFNIANSPVRYSSSALRDCCAIAILEWNFRHLFLESPITTSFSRIVNSVHTVPKGYLTSRRTINILIETHWHYELSSNW